MLSRSTLGLPLALVALLLSAGEGRAHRLVVGCEVLPGQKVQVSSRYKAIPKSIPAQEARVRVFRANGQVLVEGQTDDKGRFLFSYQRAEPLRVEVYQDGHLAEARLAAADLGKVADTGEDKPLPRKEAVSTEGGWREEVKDVLVGISFLLSAAAFLLSLRNARKLRELKQGGGRGQPVGGADYAKKLPEPGQDGGDPQSTQIKS
jgi:hypothetical protein